MVPARISKSVNRHYRRWLLTPIKTRLLSWSGLPIVAITGTNGKTTVARLLDQVLREAGYHVGMCCTDGVMRQGKWVKRGDCAGPGGVRLALKGDGIDVLIAETSRGGIIRLGFGFHTCSVAVVTNVSDDHLGFDGVETVDQMAEIKARLVKRVRNGGTAVLNADDPRVAAMAEHVRGSVIFYSMKRLPPDFRRCLFVHRDAIWRREGESEERVIATGDVAVSCGGYLRYNLANAMAVLGALDALRPTLPVDDELAATYLKSAASMPDEAFSFQLFDYCGSHVLLTNSKNPAGHAVDMPSVRKLRDTLGCTCVVGIITHVGNRRPAFHREIAAASAEVCDYVMVVPPRDEYLRGVAKESIVKALQAGIPAEKVLPAMGEDCRQIISRLKPRFPSRTLYVLLNARHLRGATELMKSGIRLTLGSDMLLGPFKSGRQQKSDPAPTSK